MPEVLFDLIMEYCVPTALRRLADQDEPHVYDGDQPTRDYMDALEQVFHCIAHGPNGGINTERVPWPHRVLTRANFPSASEDHMHDDAVPRFLPEAHGPRVHMDWHGFIE
ncbi:MAG: hypothetical protein Q7V62_13720, partial [Actinomycetota bacterium]|nr:hypothetical protein [Actinomycetota bacterium]